VNPNNPDFQEIRDALFLVAMTYAPRVKRLYEEITRPDSVEFGDREFNLFKPILAIGRAIGMDGVEERLIAFQNAAYRNKVAECNRSAPENVLLQFLLETALKVQAIGTDRVFLHNGRPVTHRDEVRWCWNRKLSKLEGLDPAPRFHDLRHTWKTNARRSGMHPEIEKAIMGHASRVRNVHEGYGLISDDELIRVIDAMTSDHGDTEILVTGNAKKKSRQRKAASAGTRKNAYNTRTKQQEGQVG